MSRRLLMAAWALGTVVAVAAAGVVIVAPASAPPVPGRLLLDPTARLFLALVQVLFVGVVVHAAVARDNLSMRRFLPWSLPFLLACDVAVISDAPVLTWAALELSTLTIAPLVVAGDRARAPAALQYFLFSSVGLGLVLLGFTFLELGAEGTAFRWSALIASPPPASPWVEVGLLLALAGFGAKLGLFPLNTWVPTTYATAPAPVAALLGAVQFNVTLVGLLRLVEAFRGPMPQLVDTFLIASGLLTMAVSTLGIVGTRDYLRLLGYASVNHGGVIALGLGLGAPAAYGVLLYALSNAFIKAILFLAAGRVRHVFGTTDAGAVNALVKLLPYSGLSLMIGSFALIGLPPFGSFLGELLILSALVESGRAWMLLPVCALLVVTFVATARTLFPMIWRHTDAPLVPHAESAAVAVPKLVFLAALVALGLYVPDPVNRLLVSVADTLGVP